MLMSIKGARDGPTLYVQNSSSKDKVSNIQQKPLEVLFLFKNAFLIYFCKF